MTVQEAVHLVIQAGAIGRPGEVLVLDMGEPVRIADGPGVPGPRRGEAAAIALHGVTFTYPGRRQPALLDVSFTVPAGAMVALVGPSGAGKTTIASLLLRFWDPDSGVITLGGHDLRRWRLEGMRREIALVAQDTHLFNDTLGGNIRIARPEATAAEVAAAIERAVKHVPGVTSAYAERLTGGRYIDVNINRGRADRYGLNVADLQSFVSSAIGGENIGQTIEGLERFPISVRYPREIRDSVQKLRDLSVLTERGAQIRLGDVADIGISDGPPMLKSENARLSSWVYIDLHGRALSSAVHDMQQAVARQVRLPAGYSLSWSGQFEFLERATARLKIVVPATLVIIFVLLYLTFRRFSEAALIMATLPFALVGGFWLMFLLGYNMSIASAVGFIALGGVSAEIGVVMIIYLDQAVAARVAQRRLNDEEALIQAIIEGAALRVRPIAMTVAVIIAGLLPIMWGSGTGSEVMRRIASPMVGGMITAPLLSMFVVPVVYMLLWRRQLASDFRSVVNAPR